jgi:ferric-dicitrate binding protein FerR (iron transport regulator)
VAVGNTVVTAKRLVEVGRDGIPHVWPADASLFSFATGVLTLGNMSLRSAVVDLDRWYDVDIRLGDTTLATQPLKGEFAAGSIADLVGILEWTYKVRVVRDGRVLTLYPRR